MKLHQLTVEDALASLHSRSTGLTAEEAQRRQHEFGPNRIDKPRTEPILRSFIRSFTNILALVLWVGAILAFVADRYDPGSGMATLGVAIIGVIVINGMFSFWQEYRAERTLAALENLLPRQITVRRDDNALTIPADEIAPGDIGLLEEGDVIPADMRVIRSFGLRVNLATVTGESFPQARNEFPDPREDEKKAHNILLAGTSIVAGRAEAVVFAIGMATEIGQISRLSHRAVAPISPLQLEIARLSRRIGFLATTIGGLFFVIGQLVGVPTWSSFVFAIGIIVANVPEGLLPTVTLALAMGSQRMARRQVLIRHLPSVETLGAVTVICTDKTGTLTMNQMAVRRVVLPGDAECKSEFGHSVEDCHDAEPLWNIARHCHDLKASQHNDRTVWIGDPMETALVTAAENHGFNGKQFSRVDELPFDTDRKRLSTLHETPDGLKLFTKGAAETVLPLCDRIWTRQGVRPLTEDERQHLLRQQDGLGEQGLRVLALAMRDIAPQEDRNQWEQQLILCGLVGLEDPLRPEVPAAVKHCQEAGIRVVMITGDHPHTALAIARQAGIIATEKAFAITGERMRRMTDTQLRLLLRHRELVFARATPDQKLRIVLAMRANREVIAVTGDGVNDAPALRSADIGIAMGQTGTDVARATADMVLLDDNFASIVTAIEEGRAVYANIRKFLTYILTSNVPELIPFLAFVLFRVPLALTVIQILVVDLGTDLLPALGLGAEPPEPGIMQQPPRPRRQRLLTGSLLIRAYLWLGGLESIAAMALFFFVLVAGGWTYGTMLPGDNLLYQQATTACLSAIVVMQVANVFNCRSDRISVFQQSPISNRLILFGVAAEIALILSIVYTSTGHWFFGTATIGFNVWLVALPFAVAMIGVEELRKWWVRRKATRSG